MISLTYSILLHSHSHDEGFGHILHHLMEELGLSHELTEFLSHIIIDCLEVMGLLLLVMGAVFFLQSYVNFDRIKAKLATLKSIWGYVLAVLLGMLSPFCSCSVIPLMLGLLSMGVPLSVCLCMLTSASLLNLTALMGISGLLNGFLLPYVSGALLLIAGSSFVMSRVAYDASELSFSREDHHEHDHCHSECCGEVHGHSEELSAVQRVKSAFLNAWNILRGVWLYILLGVGLSAALSSFFPMESIVRFVDENSLLSVVTAGLIGFPIHSDLFSSLPVLRLLLELSKESALTFALSAMSISIPGIMLLSRILRPKLLAIYSASLLILSLTLGCLSILL